MTAAMPTNAEALNGNSTRIFRDHFRIYCYDTKICAHASLHSNSLPMFYFHTFLKVCLTKILYSVFQLFYNKKKTNFPRLYGEISPLSYSLIKHALLCRILSKKYIHTFSLLRSLFLHARDFTFDFHIFRCLSMRVADTVSKSEHPFSQIAHFAMTAPPNAQ